MPLIKPVSVQLAVGATTTQATVAVPMAFPTIYVAPSAGLLETEFVSRKTTVLLKSLSIGLAQEKETCPVPAVPSAVVTLAGEALSIVKIALLPSAPVWVLMPVMAVILPIALWAEPGGTGILA